MIKGIILSAILLFQSAGQSKIVTAKFNGQNAAAEEIIEASRGLPLFEVFGYGDQNIVRVEGSEADCFGHTFAIKVYLYNRNGDTYNQADGRLFFDDLRRIAADLDLDGIPLSAMLAQAYTEGGAGKQGVYRMSNNLFGIRAGANWNGYVYARDLKKTFVNYSAAKASGSTDLFRAYEDLRDSMIDYINLIKSSEFYKKALGKTPKNYLRHLTKRGYGETSMVNVWLNVIKIYKLKGE